MKTYSFVYQAVNMRFYSDLLLERASSGHSRNCIYLALASFLSPRDCQFTQYWAYLLANLKCVSTLNQEQVKIEGVSWFS